MVKSKKQTDHIRRVVGKLAERVVCESEEWGAEPDADAFKKQRTDSDLYARRETGPWVLCEVKG